MEQNLNGCIRSKTYPNFNLITLCGSKVFFIFLKYLSSSDMIKLSKTLVNHFFLWSYVKQNPQLWDLDQLMHFNSHVFIMPKWKVKLKVIQSCPTLYDPKYCTVHGILQSRILEKGSLFLLQRIFLTQESNRRLLSCRRIL